MVHRYLVAAPHARRPLGAVPLAQLVADGWTFFEDVESAVEAAAVVKTLKKSAQLPGIDAFTGDQVQLLADRLR